MTVGGRRKDLGRLRRGIQQSEDLRETTLRNVGIANALQGELVIKISCCQRVADTTRLAAATPNWGKRLKLTTADLSPYATPQRMV